MAKIKTQKPGSLERSVRRRVREKYWAVKIGEHHPYLMVNPDSHNSPALFIGQVDAEQAALRRLSNKTACEIVRVEVREVQSPNAHQMVRGRFLIANL